MRYILILLIFLSATLQISAQKNTIPVEEVEDLDSATSMSMVYGWARDLKNDKWTTKENEIKNIDKFHSYSILSLTDEKNNSYVAIVKETKEKGLSVFDTYVLDYMDYESQITLWQEHSILKFKILKHTQTRLKKNEVLSKELLGLDNMSYLLTAPRDYFVFQYKFLKDQTVKFLFYVENCTSDGCTLAGLLTKENSEIMLPLIGTDKLYDYCFYKTTPKYFTEFTDSPLKK